MSIRGRQVLVYLAPPLAGVSVYVIARLMEMAPAWPPLPSWSPLQRVMLALLVAALNALIAPPGPPRYRMAGLLFMVVAASSVANFGGLVGLQAPWQRWLVGLVLALPFFLLLVTNTPGYFKMRLDAWKERRSRR